MKAITSFAEANQYLTKFYRNARTKYTLDNMLALMDFLDNPQEKFKTIHVAGTSGKTSTVYYASALLAATGKKVGLTVSPHVDEINERVQINKVPLPEKEFCDSLTEFLEVIQASPVKPSWFEAMAAFSYWYFAKTEVDYAVVEVGLGGLNDGTNVIQSSNKICLITDIGLDHINVLGNSLGEIAAQKAGIIQPGNAVFTYRQDADVMQVIKSECGKKQAELHIIDNPAKELPDMPDYQLRNWNLAHAAVNHVIQRDGLSSLTDGQLEETKHIKIPGRMDIREINGKTIIMDGAHNKQKMTAFLASFQKMYPGIRPAILISQKKGKEYQELAPLLAPIAGRVIITTYQATQDTPAHSMDPQILAEAFKDEGIEPEIIEDQHQAYQSLLEGSEIVGIITGSFYLLSQIRNNENLI